jgi:hypothetical protein
LEFGERVCAFRIFVAALMEDAMGDKSAEEAQEVPPEPELSGSRSTLNRERLFLSLSVGMAIAGAITGGFIAYCYATGKPWSKLWVGVWLCPPAEVAGALGVVVLRRLTVRRSQQGFEALMKWVAPAAFLSGFLVMTFWLLAWPDEMVAGPAVTVTATVFGTLAGAVGGFGLLLMVLISIYD